ncbi:MAG: hypothetical protein ACR2G4_12970 [Pyrinomonadaceae bacterium]
MNTKLNDCGRSGELVAYFYGEANLAECESFNTHLAQCGACRDELKGFTQVREAVGEWRAEILHTAPALSFVNPAAPPPVQHEAASRAVPRRSSALVALRDFFSLSPVWLRAGAMAATLVVCALAALAVVNAELRWDNNGLAFSTNLGGRTQIAAPPPQTALPAGKIFTEAQMAQLVAERDATRSELEDTRAQLEDSREANLIAASETLEPVPVSDTTSTRNNLRRERRASPARPRRLRDDRDEEDLPRLYDLLTEAN